MNYVISNIAEKDIETITDYLSEKNLQSATKFVDSLYRTFDLLGKNPYIGHKRDDLTHYPVRFWTFKWHYLIIYLPNKPIKVVRILSGYRDIAQNIVHQWQETSEG